ncbi:MAG: glycogen synthase GlgA, partial [Deltaproteobacteria bacterium]
VASECVPLVKTGGLADVVGALPRALAAQGVDMRVMLPAYPGLLKKLGKTVEIAAESDLGGGPARIMKGALDGITVLLVDAPHLFDREGGIYGNPKDYPDNPERFAAFSFAAAQIGMLGGRDGWVADILHAHDWQAALAPAFVRWADDTRLKTVLTIHNIAFQGIAPSSRMGAMRLPGWAFNADGYEYWGNINMLKAGLMTAHKLSTVSPSYANELMRGEFGMGLDGVIRARAADMIGILNGVDTDVWDPLGDEAIASYSAKTLKDKSKNRTALLREFALEDAPGPLAIVISRLTGQKGIDLIADVAPEFVASGGAIAVLGSGEPYFEDRLMALTRTLPGRVAVEIGYDEGLSHRMFAGGDAVLVPSRFEPCGLTQMYGLRYGTLPVVAATGGLNDTVIDASPAALAADAATGFMFHPTDALALQQCLRRMTDVYADPKAWAAMQVRAMKSDVSWDVSSKAYLSLYQGLLG